MRSKKVTQEIKSRWQTLDTEELNRRWMGDESTEEERAAVQELLAERGVDTQSPSAKDQELATVEAQVSSEPIWQYKCGYNDAKESNAVPLLEILTLIKNNKIRRLTPVKKNGWSDFKYAEEAPDLSEAFSKTPTTAWLNF